ncbi:MAG: ribosome maturation factor RimM [Chloroflexota bacterium]|nr:ribosome maturation factor RimM [Chloroflexota bacterium]
MPDETPRDGIEMPDALANDQPASDAPPERLMIGIIGAPHGINGAMRIRIISDFPERLTTLTHVFIGDDPQRRRLRSLRGASPSAVLEINGISSRDEASMYRGMSLYMDIRDAKPLDEGEYYWHQLIDMIVVNAAGETLGTLTGILQTGANDVYVVTQPDGAELLLPAIKDVVLEIDLPHNRMVAKPLEYL